jgi:hypothetical protein
MSTNTSTGWRQRLGVGTKKYDNLDVVKGFIAFIAQVFIITAGALLINNQMKLTKCDPEEGVVLNYTFGSILIVIGSLMVLYSLFLMIRPAKVA